MSALDLNLDWEEFAKAVERQESYAEALEHPVLPLYLLEDPARDLAVDDWRFEATLAALLRESLMTKEVDRYDGAGDGDGNGDGNGYGNGNGDGDGNGYVNADGDGNGDGNGHGDGDGDGFSNGNGYGGAA